MTVDVDPCQDDGSHKEDGQHNAHDGAQVHRGPCCLGGQVVLKACGETIRSGIKEAGAVESWVLTKSQR